MFRCSGISKRECTSYLSLLIERDMETCKDINGYSFSLAMEQHPLYQGNKHIGTFRENVIVESFSTKICMKPGRQRFSYNICPN